MWFCIQASEPSPHCQDPAMPRNTPVERQSDILDVVGDLRL